MCLRQLVKMMEIHIFLSRAAQETEGTDCLVQESITIYGADGSCHPSVSDDNYFKVTKGPIGAVTISTYPSSLCNESQVEHFVVDGWFIDTEMCYEGRKVFRTSLTALAQTPSTRDPEEPDVLSQTPPAPPSTTLTPAPTTSRPIAEAPVVDEIEARLNVMFPAFVVGRRTAEGVC
ncbi:unnamed protein product [Phytophthora lilii]|uniref:Unnamed protein product n=1 Tax=Phytophthora lilii TaxID=2077276 RepID=A0A9W6WSD0_9STRA|nr:unnamed protein product [Phytophthora lilii]